VGTVIEQVAAIASATSSGVKMASDRLYTGSALVRGARQGSMFSRSTACRHGDARNSANPTSISST
jgi:hypothetical protein